MKHRQLQPQTTFGLTSVDLGRVSGLQRQREDLGPVRVVSSMPAIERFQLEK